MSQGKAIVQFQYRPVALIILDGWGVAEPYAGNAITSALTPFYDSLIERYHTFLLQASGEAVGLPRGEIGSSEVGHMNIGAGTIVLNELSEINSHITDGTFFKNHVLEEAFSHAQKNGGTLHVMGLMSDGGVHSHIEHFFALLEFAHRRKQAVPICVHAFLDGRDVGYNTAQTYLRRVEDALMRSGSGRIGTIMGRFWAMDRDRHWDRTAAAYEAIVKGNSQKQYSSVQQAISEYYQQGIFDEDIPPTVISDNSEQSHCVKKGDAVIFFNFRPDRARQLTAALVSPSFEGFSRSLVPDLFVATFTRYDDDIPAHVVFPQKKIAYPLARVISEAGLTQLHIAETEKYAHVTYFIDGGNEEGFLGEEKVLIQSPSVSSYDKKPEMSAGEITDRVVSALEKRAYDVYVINYANADMVGHTGNLQATMRAISFLDSCFKRVFDAVLSQGGAVVMTADHGNAEMMIDARSGVHLKEHSANPVPCIIAGKTWEVQGLVSGREKVHTLVPAGVLADVAPTVLKILGLEKPETMTGRSLI